SMNSRYTSPAKVRWKKLGTLGRQLSVVRGASQFLATHREAQPLDRGRDGALAPPLPPNRTGGFPASGSPVDGVSARESALFVRFPRPPSVRQSHPSHMILAESSAAQ